MKLLTTLLLSCCLLVIITTGVKSAKSSKSKASQNITNDPECDIKLPMEALGCCPMPQFISKVIIDGCKANMKQGATPSTTTPKPTNATCDGPPPEFFDCICDTTGMSTKKNGKSVVDLTKASQYLQDQLNSTTKSTWSKVVTAGTSKCHKEYKASSNATSKVFLDCLVANFYTNCPNADKTGECPGYFRTVKKCNRLNLNWKPSRPNGQNGMNGPNGPNGPNKQNSNNQRQ